MTEQTIVQRCGYCDYQRVGPDAFVAVVEHIKSCPKHPLAKALAELAQMQLDANAVCQSLGVKWAADGNYPSFAVQAVGTLRGRAARGEWQRDEAQAELAQAQTECNVLTMTFTDANELHAIMRGELTQARAELKDLQMANRECGRQLAQRTNSRDYWVGKCQAAEIERDKIRKEAQEQSDEVQEHWLSPVEAEGLRRQLKHAEDVHNYRIKEYGALEMDLCHAAEGEAAIVEAAEMLAEKTGKVHVASALREELAAARDNMYSVLEHRSAAAAKLLERLAEAEAKLARAHWLSPDEAAAVSEWTRWESHVQERLATVAEEAAIVEAAKALLKLSPGGVTRLVLGQARRNLVEALEHRSDAAAKLLERLAEAEQRAERAEALAALVTPELATLLVLLASSADTSIQYHRCTTIAGDTKTARELAAQIREAL